MCDVTRSYQTLAEMGKFENSAKGLSLALFRMIVPRQCLRFLFYIPKSARFARAHPRNTFMHPANLKGCRMPVHFVVVVPSP